MNINLDIIKELIAKKYEHVDFIFKENFPIPKPLTIQCSIPIQQGSNMFEDDAQKYKFIIDAMYKELIKSAIMDRHEKETKAWFSEKFAQFSFSEIIRKVLIALSERNYKYIILPSSVYNMFLTSEMDVYTRILQEGNFNKTKIKFNSIVPPFFKDNEYDHINAYFVDGVDDIYLLQNEIFDIKKSTLYEVMSDPMRLTQGTGISVKLNENYIHKILMYKNDQVLSNHLKLKKIRTSC